MAKGNRNRKNRMEKHVGKATRYQVETHDKYDETKYCIALFNDNQMVVMANSDKENAYKVAYERFIAGDEISVEVISTSDIRKYFGTPDMAFYTANPIDGSEWRACFDSDELLWCAVLPDSNKGAFVATSYEEALRACCHFVGSGLEPQILQLTEAEIRKRIGSPQQVIFPVMSADKWMSDSRITGLELLAS